MLEDYSKIEEEVEIDESLAAQHLKEDEDKVRKDSIKSNDQNKEVDNPKDDEYENTKKNDNKEQEKLEIVVQKSDNSRSSISSSSDAKTEVIQDRKKSDIKEPVDRQTSNSSVKEKENLNRQTSNKSAKDKDNVTVKEKSETKANAEKLEVLHLKIIPQYSCF